MFKQKNLMSRRWSYGWSEVDTQQDTGPTVKMSIKKLYKSWEYSIGPVAEMYVPVGLLVSTTGSQSPKVTPMFNHHITIPLIPPPIAALYPTTHHAVHQMNLDSQHGAWQAYRTKARSREEPAALRWLWWHLQSDKGESMWEIVEAWNNVRAVTRVLA